MLSDLGSKRVKENSTFDITCTVADVKLLGMYMYILISKTLRKYYSTGLKSGKYSAMNIHILSKFKVSV